jgi:hypothetical protein
VAPKRRGHALIAGAAVLAIGAIVLLIGVSGSAPAPRGVATSSVAFITTSAQRTLTQQTAEVTLSGTVQADGVTIPVRGDGAINFAANSMIFNLDASFSGHSLVENEILARGNLYLRTTINGQGLNQLTGGRHWIRLPLVQSDTATLTSSPLSALSILEGQGGSVTSLGTKKIDGENCAGYAVTPSEQAMLAGARQEFAKLGLSPTQVSAEILVLQRTPPLTVTVWFDSHQLTRAMSVAMQLSGVASSGSVNAQIVMDFTHYGVPVRIVTPVPSGRRHFGGAATLGHTGRRSGRTYTTPVGAHFTGDTAIIPLTFGNTSDWVRNVRSAGGCLTCRWHPCRAGSKGSRTRSRSA